MTRCWCIACKQRIIEAFNWRVNDLIYLELSALGLRLLLEGLDGLLEPLGHLLLEVLGARRVGLAHVLVLVLQVGPVLHHLQRKKT